VHLVDRPVVIEQHQAGWPQARSYCLHQFDPREGEASEQAVVEGSESEGCGVGHAWWARALGPKQPHQIGGWRWSEGRRTDNCSVLVALTAGGMDGGDDRTGGRMELG
jgi:hypothetical protein